MCDEIIRKKLNNIVHILMGNFNLITNGHIDQTPPQHISRPKFFNDLETLGLIDLYRKLNKEELGNTCHKEGVNMRIDQIWVSKIHSNKLLNFSITPLTFITSSDYNIIILTMDTSALIRNNRKNTVYDKLPTDNVHTRVMYNCNNIETKTVNLAEYSQEDIDRLHNTFKQFNKKKSSPERHTNKLLQLLLWQPTNEDTKVRWTIKIAKYNQDYVTSTDDNNKCNIDTHDIFSEEWFNTLKTKRLATEYGEVKKVMDNDFARIFRKRNTLLETMTPFWQQIYEPAGKFKEAIESTIEKITKEEWNKTVRELNKKSAAGLSAWKTLVILPIPKPINFEYNILNTQPIALLDCF
ncbi:hypothetical protein RhiirA4_481495 [Rhizophagus irregularis]|uniref:Uncharacterized protein n=1 Tax=Rhizophagus irregularis TaxID=588596 RepID=A0A2I1HJJ5_9GLOM|nr:hypothetical protein RhiirA4_481495 [Rhizophagus irregularis]